MNWLPLQHEMENTWKKGTAATRRFQSHGETNITGAATKRKENTLKNDVFLVLAPK